MVLSNGANLLVLSMSGPPEGKGSPIVLEPGAAMVEAMKLMNEIEADADGVITRVFPQNAQAVEFGEPLFAIDTDS